MLAKKDSNIMIYKYPGGADAWVTITKTFQLFENKWVWSLQKPPFIRFNMDINNRPGSITRTLISFHHELFICKAGVVCGEDFWPVSAGFPSVSRNRDAYQSIDQQADSSSSANPFNQTQDNRPVRTAYWESREVKDSAFPSAFVCSSTELGSTNSSS